MKYFFSLILCLSSILAQAESKITLFIGLTPAGSFQAVSKKAKGNLVKQGEVLSTDKISVTVESFKTGIDLRDEHLWKHLKSEKALLTGLKAQAGKGTATLEVNGIKQPINISYEEKGNEVFAKFQVKASSFKLPKAEYLGVGVNDLVIVEAVLPFSK